MSRAKSKPRVLAGHTAVCGSCTLASVSENRPHFTWIESCAEDRDMEDLVIIYIVHGVVYAKFTRYFQRRRGCSTSFVHAPYRGRLASPKWLSAPSATSLGWLPRRGNLPRSGTARNELNPRFDEAKHVHGSEWLSPSPACGLRSPIQL